MRALCLAILLTVAQPALAADEKTTIATGDWSEAVNGVRGRLIIAQGRTLGDSKIRESLVYVELENVAHTHSGQVNIQFDPDALKCALTDADGKVVPQTPIAGSGGRPGKTLVTIPFDSSVRLRANPFAFGRAEGLLIHLNTGSWHIKDDAVYHFSGTLTVTAPEGKADSWKGEIKLAKTKISLKPTLATDDSKPLGPVEARKQVGKDITVQMEAKTTKDRLEKRGEIYLDAEEDFKSEKNFAIVITKKGAASLKEAGITDPADHFKRKTITAKGTVKEVDGVPRIEIDEAKQITVVKAP